MEIGQTWAYRSSNKGRFHSVRILAIGHKVRVEFEELRYEGERRWVPQSRLEVPWTDVDAYLEAEARWNDVEGDDVDDHEYRAAEVVFLELVPDNIAELRTDGYKGVADVPAIEAFAALLQVDVHVLCTPPSFRDEDGWHLPWPTTLAMARTACERYPDKIYADVEGLQERYRRPLVLGEDATDIVTDEDYRRPPEKVQAIYAKYELPIVSILRAWIGEERSAERVDVAGLARELSRVAGIADRAITALQARSKREGQGYRDELEDQLRPFDFGTWLDDGERRAALADVQRYFWRHQQSAGSPQEHHKTTRSD